MAFDLVIRNATVIDGTGAPPLHDAVIVIEDDRITKLRPFGGFCEWQGRVTTRPGGG